MEQVHYRYWLANLHNIGIKKIERLLAIYGNAEEVFKASKEEFASLKRVGAFSGLMSDKDLEMIHNNRDSDRIMKDYGKLKHRGIQFITIEEEQYPERLRNIYGAPYALYIKGSLPKEEDKLIAVVGARECTHYGMEMAKYLAGAIAGAGVPVISGLARGIDTCAHQGALHVGGRTYAVMGCGIDICYPRDNINYYMDMQQHGGVISEYAPGVQPIAGNFPMRNRIISGLCDGILVIEAKEKSGSLITVEYGLEQGKEIYALPGRATDRLSQGCNNLIRMGAKLVTSPKDILEDLLPEYIETELKAENCTQVAGKPNSVYACLNSEPTHIEAIAYLTGLPVELLAEQLLRMELEGSIRQPIKNYYITVR